jgi:hypothetical protein
MKHARTEYHGHHEEKSDSRVQDIINYAEHLRLRKSADECQNISDEIEFSHLRLR